jgi:hypothetical protein
MTTTAPTRFLVLAGIALAALAGFLLVLRPMLLEDDEAATSKPAGTPAQQAPSKSTRARAGVPRVQLNAGLPAPLAKQLRYSNVVIVTLFTPKAGADRQALVQARAGARSAGAGFVALNVTRERLAQQLSRFAGATTSPTTLVVTRPGTIVNRLDGNPDRQIVAQAAQNAGAGAKQRAR